MEIDEIEEFSGEVYNSFYIYYEDSGYVHLISNIQSLEFKNLEINPEMIPNFILGKKDCRKYNIIYFQEIKEGKITDEDDSEDLIKTEYHFYNIDKHQIHNPEIILKYNKKKKCWVIKKFNILEEKLTVQSSIPIYVVKFDSPHFLYATYIIDANKLLEESQEFNFQSTLEEDLENISLLTIRKLKFSLEIEDV
jgi:hypothetical protein